MVEIVWTEEALRWLQEIFTYISEDSPTAARKVVSGIYDKVQLLKDFPEIGYQYRSENEGDIRVLLYGHYRIAYLLKSTTRIEILGVFHGALYIDSYFTKFDRDN